MGNNPRRMLAVATGLAGILVLMMTWVTAQSSPPQTSSSEPSSVPKTTDQVYKNIKVLKGVPAS